LRKVHASVIGALFRNSGARLLGKLQDSLAEEELEVNRSERHAHRRSQKEPADTQPEGLVSVFDACHGTPEIEDVKMIDAAGHFRLEREVLSFRT
jgi:hypothetical protein